MSSEPSKLPPERLMQPVTMKWFTVIFGGSLVYAVVRYHFAGDVPWAHFPLFILNKATSLAAVCFLASSYLIGRVFKWHDHDKDLRLVVIKFCGLIGFFLAGIHACMSLCLLRPSYYGKFFDADGRLSLVGELSMTTGVIGLFLLLAPAISSIPMMPKAIGGWRWKRGQRMGYLALGLVAVHLIVMGWRGWMAPGSWHGGMPPISMLAVVAALVPLVVRCGMDRARRDEE